LFVERRQTPTQFDEHLIETEASAHTQIINETADPFDKQRTAFYISIRVDAKYIGILAEIADENTRPEAT
jgi:hypothetical protein